MDYKFLTNMDSKQRIKYIKELIEKSKLNNYDYNDICRYAPEIIDVFYKINNMSFINFINILDSSNINSSIVMDKLAGYLKTKKIKMSSKMILAIRKLSLNNFNKLIEVAFKADLISTLNAISENYQLFDRDYLINLLDNHVSKDFVFDEGNKNLSKIDSRLLLTSLKNNFDKTIEMFASSIKGINDEDAKKISYIYLRKINKKDFVLNEELLSLAMIDHLFIDYSFASEPRITFYELLNDSDHRFDNYLQSNEFFELISQNKDFYLDNESFSLYKEIVGGNPVLVNKIINISLKHNFIKTIELQGAFISCSIKTIVSELMNTNNYLSNNKTAKSYISDFFNAVCDDLDQLYNMNKERFLDLLAHSDIDKYSKKLEDKIVELLSKDSTYVIGYSNNSPYLSKIMFLESLKNDYVKTMQFDIKSFYRIDTFIEYQFTYHKQQIKKELINGILNNNLKINDNHLFFFNADPSIVVELLKSDYNHFMSLIPEKWNLSNYLIIKDEQISEEIISILNSNNFLLNESNKVLFHISPCFLIASLQTNYNETKLFIENIKVMNRFDLNTYELEKIRSICLQHNDNDLFYEICSRNINLFIDLLAMDKDIAFNKLNKLKINRCTINKNQADTIEGILHDQDFSFNDCPNLATLLAHPVLSKSVDNEQLNFRKFLFTHDFPISLFDFHSYQDMNYYLNTPEEKYIAKLMLENNGLYKYKKEDENILLKALNTDSKTIEEEIKKWHDLKLKRSDLSLIQMISFIFYGKKIEFIKGIEGYPIKVFEYTHDWKRLGAFNEFFGDISLYNGHNDTIYQMIQSLHHEINHCRQCFDRCSLNIESDPDIIIYSKDNLLKFILMELYNYDYYSNNYWNIAIEYDTDFKADMETISLLKYKDKNQEDNSVDDSPLEIYKYGKENNNYYYDTTREFDFKKYYLNDLYIQQVNKAIDCGLIDKYIINDICPLLLEEFTYINGKLALRSNQDLIDVYNNCNDDKEKKIILGIISNRLDYRYNKDIENNIKEFMEYNENLDINKVLIEQIQKYENYKKDSNKTIDIELSKYLHYIDSKYTTIKFIDQNKKGDFK